MRHAKSDWEAGAQSDHARPLNDRGRREAPSVGKRLVEMGATASLVISSDAARTRETWERIQPSFASALVEFEPTFYLAGIESVRARLATVGDEVKSVLILGHNPGWEQVVAELTGDRAELKTAYAAVLESRSDGAWSELLATPTFDVRKIVKPTEG